MHYDPRLKNHGLPHDPFPSLIVPRPIGWISTMNENGLVNLAPYSFFNAISGKPPFVMFSSDARKDSQNNAERSGEFVANLATYDLREQMNLSSAVVGPEVSEPELVGLEMTPSTSVKTPRVKRSPVAIECRYAQTVRLQGSASESVIGEVVGIYVDDAIITNGRVDLMKARPIGRLGYMDYTLVEGIFTMMRPT